MITQGLIQVDSDIAIWMSPPSNGAIQVSTTEMEVTSSPIGSIFRMNLVNATIEGGIWEFNTDTPGEYKFEGTRWIQFTQGIQNLDKQTLTLEIASLGPNPITQTHTPTYATENLCSNMGILVTASVLMKQVNDVILDPPRIDYVLNKVRRDLNPTQINIVADDPQFGANSKITNLYAPIMSDVFATGKWLDVTITLPEVYETFEYDFGDGYQSSNKYHYQSPGIKVINVRDTWGCVKSIAHETSPEPNINPNDIPLSFFISKGMSLRFVLRPDGGFNNCSTYKTDENTFDCEVDYLDLDYNHLQRIKQCQDIPTQFKASYDQYTVALINAETGNVVYNPKVTRVQKNLLVTSALTYLREDDENYSYIYFSSGFVPYYFQVGSNVVINGEATKILGFTWLEDQDVQAFYVRLLSVADGGLITYLYNKQTYDVYEFLTEFTKQNPGFYYMTIIATKNAVTLNYQTDIFQVAGSYEQTVDLAYYCDSNTDIYYRSGIKNFLTFGIESRAPNLNNELEMISGDEKNYLKSSFFIEEFTYVFEPLTLEMFRKLAYAFGNQYLVINGTSYAAVSLEVATPNPETNLYVLTAIVVKSNENVKFISGEESFDFSSGIVEFSSSITFDRTTYKGYYGT